MEGSRALSVPEFLAPPIALLRRQRQNDNTLSAVRTPDRPGRPPAFLSAVIIGNDKRAVRRLRRREGRMLACS
jgi:hypothetical protein